VAIHGGEVRAYRYDRDVTSPGFAPHRNVAGPLVVAKGLVAGGANLALALAAGARLPAPPTLAGAAVLGFFAYGMSLVLFVFALRYLGSGRTGAYFSTAPFIGVALAVILLSEPVGLRLAQQPSSWASASTCVSSSGTSMSTNMRRWSTSTDISMTRITNMHTHRTTRLESHIPIATATLGSRIAIRTSRTSITVMAMVDELNANDEKPNPPISTPGYATTLPPSDHAFPSPGFG
jgi:hypothetical protein